VGTLTTLLGTTTTGGTTTTAGTTTTLGTTTTAGGATTTVCPTTTTLSPTTTTLTTVHISSISSDHVAGHPATVNGTAGANKVVIVRGTDHKRGTHRLGEVTAAGNGSWHLHLAHGVLYNTVVQAFSGTQRSNRRNLPVHQVLRIKSDKFIGETAQGFRYKLTGSSASRIPGEAITVRFNGRVVGKGRLHSNGTFTITFTLAHKHAKLNLHGTGRNASGVEYTLTANRSFRV
jgi:hypothetical protein